MPDLLQTLAKVRRQIQGLKRPLMELDTKAALIEPVLRALGWDTEVVDEVRYEFKVKKNHDPVDYGLVLDGTPCFLLEAKALGESLANSKWAAKIMSYAAFAGVQWIVLTNGNDWHIYNAHAPVSIEEKLFRKVHVSDNDPLAAPTLELLARDRWGRDSLDRLWEAHFVDRRVHEAVDELFNGGNDMLLVDYITKRTKKLSAEAVRASLARGRFKLEFPVLSEIKVEDGPNVPLKPGKKVTLLDLIRAEIIVPPLPLQHAFKKGETLTARVDKEGRVEFAGKVYGSPSGAGAAARASIGVRGRSRRPPETDGWSFWKVGRSDGSLVPLGQLRKEYGARKRKGAAG